MMVDGAIRWVSAAASMPKGLRRRGFSTLCGIAVPSSRCTGCCTATGLTLEQANAVHRRAGAATVPEGGRRRRAPCMLDFLTATHGAASCAELPACRSRAGPWRWWRASPRAICWRGCCCWRPASERWPGLQTVGIGGPTDGRARLPEPGGRIDKLAVQRLCRCAEATCREILGIRNALADRLACSSGRTGFVGIDAPDFNLGLGATGSSASPA